jgi:uncharacterized protein (TIGR02217 family)
MALHKKLFPLDMSQLTHTPLYRTTIWEGASGQEVRNSEWQDALRKYNAKFSVKTLADLRTLVDFWHTVRGCETGFLIKDYMDFKVDNQGLHGEIVPNGVRTEFQVFKIYVDLLGNYIRRDVTYIDEDADFIVKINNVTVNEADYSVNYDTGVITFDTAPAGGSTVHVTCEFRVPVRFDMKNGEGEDELPVTLIMYDLVNDTGLAEMPDIWLKELRSDSV